jgi:hypothetical protein
MSGAMDRIKMLERKMDTSRLIADPELAKGISVSLGGEDAAFLLRAFKVMREIAVNLQARELTRGTNFRPADVLDGAERWVDPEFEAAMQKPLGDRPG